MPRRPESPDRGWRVLGAAISRLVRLGRAHPVCSAIVPRPFLLLPCPGTSMRWRSDTRRRTQKGRPSGRPSAGLVGEEGLEPSLPFGKRFFPTTTAFAASPIGCLWPGPSLHPRHYPLRVRPVWSLHLPPADRGLGSGLACRWRRQPPPNLRRSAPGVSPGALNIGRNETVASACSATRPYAVVDPRNDEGSPWSPADDSARQGGTRRTGESAAFQE
jgi:hypothetical protein